MSKIPTKQFIQHEDQYIKLLIFHFLKKLNTFHKIFDLCENNQNQPHFLLFDVKIVFKIMDMEEGLYAQIFVIYGKYLDDTKEKTVRLRYINSRSSLQDQNSGLILIMSG